MPADTAIAALTVNRKGLLVALTRMSLIVPTRTYKPILQGVRLEALDGLLRMTATDLDFGLYISLEAQGGLPRCVVSCDELARRLKAGKSDVCTLASDPDGEHLTVNGGQVDHKIGTLALGDFPAVPTQAEGERLTLPGPVTRNMLAIAQVATAQESTRYALDGILLEADKKGVRLIATDGRRMVFVQLGPRNGAFKGQVVLPRRIAFLLGKLIAKKNSDHLEVVIRANTDAKGDKEPADLFLIGSDWLLSCKEVDGSFPRYTDVLPKSHSKFVVKRQAFLDTLGEVALASNEENRGVRLDLSAENIRLTAGPTEVAQSHGCVPCTFAGGGDDAIITGFNPAFLLDAFKHEHGDRVVIDVAQNRFGQLDGKVYGSPALVYGQDHLEVCWLLMPINLGLAPSRESLGSNFPEENEPKEATPAVAPPVKRRRRATTPTPAVSNPSSPQRRKANYKLA